MQAETNMCYNIRWVLMFEGGDLIKHSILRLMIEAVGWIMTVIGAYFVFGEAPSFIHYFIFVLGIVLIVFYFPYKDFKRKKRELPR